MGHQIVCALALVAMFPGTPSGARTRARGASAQGAASGQGGVLAWGAVVLQSACADKGRHGRDRGGSGRDRSSCHGCTAGKAHSRLRGGPFGDAGAAERAIEGRYLRWNWEDDGSLRLEARLPADAGAIVLNGLRAAEEQRPETDVHGTDAGVARRGGPRRCAGSAGAIGGGRIQVWSRWCRRVPLVVHVDAGTLASDQVAERCHVEDGPAVAPETARRLGCDAGVVRIVERDGRPLTVGRRTRTIPPALRRALRSRDAGCRFPGCTHERFLHAHHIRHWAKGGPTTLENLVQLCSYHHRLVHEGGFGVESSGGSAVVSAA